MRMNFNALNGNVLREGNVEDFMEGIECHVPHEVMQEAWLRFWGKNQLSVDSHGTVYRTSIPRRMPSNGKFDLVNYERRKKKMYP